MGSRLFFFLFISVFAAAHGDQFIREVDQPIERVFVAQGYDNDDAIQFMVFGKLPHGCFQIGTIFSEVSRRDKQIKLHMTSYEYTGECNFRATFHREVFMGRIYEPGNYEILDKTNGKSLGHILIKQVEQGGMGTDSSLYAPLVDAYLTRKNHVRYLHLAGVFDRCMELEGVEFLPQTDVLVASPKLVILPPDKCAKTERAVARDFAIQFPLPKPPFLLHVRALGGQAINKMVVR